MKKSKRKIHRRRRSLKTQNTHPLNLETSFKACDTSKYCPYSYTERIT